MSNYGFTEQNTPGESVREFYRQQGEIRAKAKFLKLVYELQADTDGAVFEVLDWLSTLIEKPGILDPKSVESLPLNDTKITVPTLPKSQNIPELVVKQHEGRCCRLCEFVTGGACCCIPERSNR